MSAYPNLFEVLTDDGDNIAKEIDRKSKVIIKDAPAAAQKKKDAPKKAQPTEEAQTPEGGFETQGQNRPPRPRTDKSSPEVAQGGDRGQRGGRGGRGGFRGDRPPRTNGEGQQREGAGQPRQPREQGDRPPRGDRPEGERRPPRGDRDANGQQQQREGGPREASQRGGRGPRAPRPDGERVPREDRPPRQEGEGRPPRGDRPPRRENEDGQVREYRGPREDRPPRDYAPREEGEGGFRRGGRGGGRGGRGGFERGPREDRGEGNVDAGQHYEGHSGYRRPREERLTEDKGFVQAKQRAYDRKSATGRNDTEKRKGHGPNNWGSVGEETSEAIAEAVAFEKSVENDSVPTDVPVDGEAAAAAPADAKESATEEDKTITLKEYRQANEKELAQVALPPPRPAGENSSEDWSNYKPIEKKGNDDFKITFGKKEQAKKKEGESPASTPSTKNKTPKGSRVPIDQVLKVKTEQPRHDRGPREDRQERGDRGHDRRQRGGRQQQQQHHQEKAAASDSPKPDSASTSEFPALVSSVASGVSSVASAVGSVVSSVVSSVLPSGSTTSSK